MLRSIGTRFGSSFVTIIGASIISFVLLRVLPGNPARLIAGPLASEQTLEAVTTRLGLNDPLPVQYWGYITDFVQGDWGFSFTAGQPVRVVLGNRIPATMELAIAAFIFAFIGALLLALLATYRNRPLIDRIVRGISSFGLGTPPFWFAMIALIIFFEQFSLFPGPSGRLNAATIPPIDRTGFYTIDALLAGEFDVFAEALWHLILPAISLGFVPMAFLTRLLRANLLEIAREPYMLVVRSKGISEWMAFARHALPNAFLPTLTASGLILAELLTGSVLVEKIFAWPGVGSLVVDAILRQDYAIVQSFILISAILYVLVNLIVDILYGVIDPRTRLPVS